MNIPSVGSHHFSFRNCSQCSCAPATSLSIKYFYSNIPWFLYYAVLTGGTTTAILPLHQIKEIKQIYNRTSLHSITSTPRGTLDVNKPFDKSSMQKYWADKGANLRISICFSVWRIHDLRIHLTWTIRRLNTSLMITGCKNMGRNPEHFLKAIITGRVTIEGQLHETAATHNR